MDKPVTIELIEENEFKLRASSKVVGALIGNLLRNAIHYTETGTVKAYVGERSISIHDNGPGITDQELEHVFKPFYRGAERRKNGYGVGLAIVKRIIQQFDWSINVDNNVRRGTKVIVCFDEQDSKA